MQLVRRFRNSCEIQKESNNRKRTTYIMDRNKTQPTDNGRSSANMSGIDVLSSQVQSWLTEIGELKREKEELLQKLEEAEKKNEELSSYSRGIGGGSYDESGPAPPHLQKAVDSVQFELGICSGAIIGFIRSVSARADSPHNSEPEFPNLDGVIRVSDFSFPGIDRALCSTIYNSSHRHGTSHLYLQARDSHDSKLALQALLCSIFFTESYNWAFPPTPPGFRRPDQLKSELFQTYRLCESDDILLNLLINDLWDDIVKRVRTCNDPPHHAAHQVPDVSKIDIPDNLKPSLQNLLYFLLYALQSKQLRGLTYRGKLVLPEGLLRDNDFKVSFVRLARTAWLMHILEFSFKPPAEMIRVPPASQFDQDFMEDRTPILHDFRVGVDGDDVTGSSSGKGGDQNMANGVGDRLVAFMCVPGFTVRSIVVKPEVVCIRRDALNEDPVQFLSECSRVGFPNV